MARHEQRVDAPLRMSEAARRIGISTHELVQRYVESVHPAERASIVIDNNDFAQPQVTRAPL